MIIEELSETFEWAMSIGLQVDTDSLYSLWIHTAAVHFTTLHFPNNLDVKSKTSRGSKKEKISSK